MLRLPALWLLLVLSAPLAAQQPGAAVTEGKSHLASLDLHLPVGVFARSHRAGIGLNYSWSHQRFGMDITGKRLVGLTANAGADYYIGKSTTPAGYAFRYGNYLYLHAMAGMLLNITANSNIALVTGPTLGIYKGNSDAGLGVTLCSHLFLTANLSAGPGVTYQKHAQTEALWTALLRFSYAF